MPGRRAAHRPSLRLAGLAGLVAVALAIPGWYGAARERDGVVADGATFAPRSGAAGLVVTSLATDGMAARAGLRVGDVIDAIDGDDAPSPADMVLIDDDPGAILHVAARGDVGAHTLLLRRPEVTSREDPDRRGR